MSRTGFSYGRNDGEERRARAGHRHGSDPSFIRPLWSPASLFYRLILSVFRSISLHPWTGTLDRPADDPPGDTPLLRTLNREEGRSRPLTVLDRLNRPANERTDETHQVAPAGVSPSSAPLLPPRAGRVPSGDFGGHRPSPTR